MPDGAVPNRLLQHLENAQKSPDFATLDAGRQSVITLCITLLIQYEKEAALAAHFKAESEATLASHFKTVSVATLEDVKLRLWQAQIT